MRDFVRKGKESLYNVRKTQGRQNKYKQNILGIELSNEVYGKPMNL